MLYHIARFLIRISLLLFFRKRYMHRIKELYTDKPLLICANHANSFLDAMLLMVLTRRTYHVVVRADVFNKPWANYLLRKFNLIPIYRMKDGIDQLGKNEETFNECIRVFENKGALIIFPEASCFSEKRLRRLHKGAAKLAFAAEEKNGFCLGIEVLSVGINYERLSNMGGYLHLRCGEKFSLAEYRAVYEENKHQAYRQVTERVDANIRREMIIIEHKKNEQIFDEAVLLKYTMSNDFQALKALAVRVDTEAEPEMNMAVTEYFSLLKIDRLHHSTVEESVILTKRKFWLRNLVRLIDAIALFPFFLVGLLFNGLAFFLPYVLSRRAFKEDVREFDSSIVSAGTPILFFFTYLAIFLVLYSYTTLLSTLVIMVFIALCGFVALVYYRETRRLVSAIRFILLRKDHREALLEYYSILKGMI